MLKRAPLPIEFINKKTDEIKDSAHFDSRRFMQLLEQVLIELRLANIYRAEMVDGDYEKDISDIQIGGQNA